MRGLLIALAFIGAYWATSNLPSELATLVGLVTLGVMFTASIALAVKWVRNA